MKKFVPTNFDLSISILFNMKSIADYDKELMKKQLDLDTVEITLTKDEEKAKQYEMDL